MPSTVANVVEAVRLRIEAQVSGLTRSRTVDVITNEPDHLVSAKFAVWPSRTVNQRSNRPTDGQDMATDTLDVQLAQRLTVDEVGSFDTLLAQSRSVRIALTADTWWKANGIRCIEYVSERRQRRDGWVIITQSYSLLRDMELG